MTVMNIRLAHGVLSIQQTHDHGRLPMQRKSIRNRSKHPPLMFEPRPHQAKHGGRIVNMLQHMSENDAVEFP